MQEGTRAVLDHLSVAWGGQGTARTGEERRLEEERREGEKERRTCGRRGEGGELLKGVRGEVACWE